MSKRLYLIAGPNGAGKTTASYTLLPELWNCREFVNADEIARGLSPLNPDEMALQAGRLQLERIKELLDSDQTFAIETTLASKSYRNLIENAHSRGYKVELIFFYLPTSEDAIERVRLRVVSGGHSIPEDVIRRRYDAGLKNLFQIYIPIVDKWSIYNNLVSPSALISGSDGEANPVLFNAIKKKYGV